jgi:hypothetical protein
MAGKFKNPNLNPSMLTPTYCTYFYLCPFWRPGSTVCSWCIQGKYQFNIPPLYVVDGTQRHRYWRVTNTVVTMYTVWFKILKFTVLSTQCADELPVTLTIYIYIYIYIYYFPNVINLLFFIMETARVFCEVGTDFLYVIIATGVRVTGWK